MSHFSLTGDFVFINLLIDTGKYNPHLPSGGLIIILCIGPIADPLHSVHFRLAIFNLSGALTNGQ